MVKVWKQGCGGQLWCIGYERRTAYYTDYRQVYSMEYQTVYKCCPGWSQLGGDAGCLYSVCNYGVCFNGGNCMEGSSQLCRCPSGFQGPRCQYDVNECEAGNGGCESQCCNTIGSFYCKCPDGLRLKGDGKVCEGRNGMTACWRGPAIGGFDEFPWLLQLYVCYKELHCSLRNSEVIKLGLAKFYSRVMLRDFYRTDRISL
ncbi:axonemal dynein light intermediate polypeptide 1 [Platysternon megacephalum]|uniref:Axonemal dynein light intermediate polypeptide 1 n=1 Tax=Platysternon megacephalum TaxID=55544 RepID=A0A4D9EZR5_9SAUR|nr:axonemal dynein light intermediate polypeptide 1 [Platysternon megacephalum]